MHLLRIVIGLALGVGVSFYFTIPLMEYLAVPVGGLENLQAIQVTEEIGVFMRVALTSGIAIMLPYIAFEIWLFAAPGLTRASGRTLFGIPLATLLSWEAWRSHSRSCSPPPCRSWGLHGDLQNWTAREYFGFVTGLMMWIGMFFEFPL
jgi:Sec-independent protein secretion pathway component TatC